MSQKTSPSPVLNHLLFTLVVVVRLVAVDISNGKHVGDKLLKTKASILHEKTWKSFQLAFQFPTISFKIKLLELIFHS